MPKMPSVQPMPSSLKGHTSVTTDQATAKDSEHTNLIDEAYEAEFSEHDELQSLVEAVEESDNQEGGKIMSDADTNELLAADSNKMPKAKYQFCFYAHFANTLYTLETKEDRITLMFALIGYGCYGVEPELEYPLSATFEALRHDIDSYHKSVTDGKTGGRPRKDGSNAKSHK